MFRNILSFFGSLCYQQSLLLEFELQTSTRSTSRTSLPSLQTTPTCSWALEASAPLQQSSITSNAGLRLTIWLSIPQRPKSWLSTEPDVGVHPTWLPPLLKEQKGYSPLGSSESSSILSFQWRST